MNKIYKKIFIKFIQKNSIFIKRRAFFKNFFENLKKKFKTLFLFLIVFFFFKKKTWLINLEIKNFQNKLNKYINLKKKNVISH